MIGHRHQARSLAGSIPDVTRHHPHDSTTATETLPTVENCPMDREGRPRDIKPFSSPITHPHLIPVATTTSIFTHPRGNYMYKLLVRPKPITGHISVKPATHALVAHVAEASCPSVFIVSLLLGFHQ